MIAVGRNNGDYEFCFEMMSGNPTTLIIQRDPGKFNIMKVVIVCEGYRRNLLTFCSGLNFVYDRGKIWNSLKHLCLCIIHKHMQKVTSTDCIYPKHGSSDNERIM